MLIKIPVMGLIRAFLLFLLSSRSILAIELNILLLKEFMMSKTDRIKSIIDKILGQKAGPVLCTGVLGNVKVVIKNVIEIIINIIPAMKSSLRKNITSSRDYLQVLPVIAAGPVTAKLLYQTELLHNAFNNWVLLFHEFYRLFMVTV